MLHNIQFSLSSFDRSISRNAMFHFGAKNIPRVQRFGDGLIDLVSNNKAKSAVAISALGGAGAYIGYVSASTKAAIGATLSSTLALPTIGMMSGGYLEKKKTDILNPNQSPIRSISRGVRQNITPLLGYGVLGAAAGVSLPAVIGAYGVHSGMKQYSSLRDINAMTITHQEKKEITTNPDLINASRLIGEIHQKDAISEQYGAPLYERALCRDDELTREYMKLPGADLDSSHSPIEQMLVNIHKRKLNISKEEFFRRLKDFGSRVKNFDAADITRETTLDRTLPYQYPVMENKSTREFLLQDNIIATRLFTNLSNVIRRYEMDNGITTGTISFTAFKSDPSFYLEKLNIFEPVTINIAIHALFITHDVQIKTRLESYNVITPSTEQSYLASNLQREEEEEREEAGIFGAIGDYIQGTRSRIAAAGGANNIGVLDALGTVASLSEIGGRLGLLTPRHNRVPPSP